MPLTTTELAQEAAFADASYIKFSGQLELNETFYSKYAVPRYAWDWRQYGARLLGSVSGSKVLDYGCGQGEESTYLALLGAHVTAIDISPVGIELTRARAAYNGVGDRVDARVMRCDPTDFPGESFDIVHGFGILHHLGIEQSLREVYRVLRSGGKGIFFEHMGNSSFIERIKRVERIKRDEEYTEHEQALRWDDVIAHAKKFRVVKLHPFHLMSRLHARIPVFGSPTVKRLDHLILTLCPPLRYFAGGLVIYVEK